MFSLTHEESLVLSRIAYMNIADGTEFKDKIKNKSLKELAEQLIQEKEAGNPRDFGSFGGLTNKEQYKMLEDIKNGKYPNLSNLKLKDYDNQNETNGFVAYAFYDANNPKNVVCAFRGSEGNPVGDEGFLAGLRGKTGIDWIDNLYLGTKGVSAQFEPTKSFVERNMVQGGQTFVTGHSKGSANAAYACAVIDGVTGFGFDGPGIGQALTPEEIERLKKSGFINCVNQNDPVGALLFHPEKRIFAKHRSFYELDKNGEIVLKDGKPVVVDGAFSGHYIQGLQFDADGKIISTNERSFLYSEAVEKITQITYILNELTGQPLGEVVKGIHRKRTEIEILQSAIADLRKDISSAIEDNTAKTQQAINTIIIKGTRDIKQKITNCGNDIAAIKKEINQGADNIKREIEKEVKSLQTKLAKDLSHITAGAGEIWSIINLEQQMKEIMMRISTGDSVIEAIFQEELERFRTFIAGGKSLKAGLEGLKTHSEETLKKAIGTLLAETEKTLWSSKDELTDLVRNTTEISLTIKNTNQRIKESIKQGFLALAKRFAEELAENYSKARNKLLDLDKQIANREIDANKLRVGRITGSVGAIYNNLKTTVTLHRLNDLGLGLRRLNNEFDEQLSGSLNMVRRLINRVNAEYRETYVRAASAEVLREVEQIERVYRRISEELQRKEIALRKAVDKYAETELRIVNSIVKA